MARTAPPLALNSDLTDHLQTLLRQGTLEQRVAKRCRVLLLAAEGLGNVEIGTKLDLHRNGVAKIRNRFTKDGLDCLVDATRPGKPSVHTAQTKQKIVTTVCGKPPKGLSRWSARTLASKLRLSKSFVHSVLV
ncbi:MAG: helix-turn-helix domain-containing protein [Akkermansiaceae bacterium]|nr:helix-turn-helix domain-containing protein [Akkermansiaceae bacterium]